MKSKFQTYYDRTYQDSAQEFKEESLTNPVYESQCDINYLLMTFNGVPRTPVYGEQSNLTFEDWQNEKARLQARFNDLTPEVKKQFGTPAEFFKFCTDPSNYYEEQATAIPEVVDKVEESKKE